MFVGFFSKPADQINEEEFRVSVKALSVPKRLADWKKLPTNIDAYLSDHFGFRDMMIAFHSFIGQNFLGALGNEKVLRANNDWMFYRGDEMLSQSAGKLIRVDGILETAKVLRDMRLDLASRGINLIVAPAPNSSSIYSDEISGWPDLSNQSTEYDFFIQELTRQNVITIDLRPVLKEARTSGAVYFMHDTHWNARGALSAYNAVVMAAGHPEWRKDAKLVLGPPVRVFGGDLARMLGISNKVSEITEHLSLGDGIHKSISTDLSAFEVTTSSHYTRTVMVLGDSFTRELFPPLIAANGVRVIWHRHSRCDLNWRWIIEQHPDEIWYIPTERFQLCNKRPSGLSFFKSHDK